MSMLLTVLEHAIGIILFLFVTWRALREDYTSESIFSSSFTIIIGALVGGIIASALGHSLGASRLFSPRGMWFWGGSIGLVSAFFYVLKRYNIRFFELVETTSIGGLIWLATLSLFEAVRIKNSTAGILFGILFLLIILFFFLQKNYRRFRWYKSGKIGLAGLVTLALFFLVRAILAIFFYEPMLSFGRISGYSIFMGRVDAIISATIAFCFILSIYNLSRVKR